MDETDLQIRVGVADLMATYQFLVDHGYAREVSQLFLPDGVFVTNTAKFIGPAEIFNFFKNTGGAFASADILPARHHLSSILIRPRSDGSATTYACFQLVGSAGLDHWGTYRDEVVNTPEGWRFARRKAKVEGHVPGSPMYGLLQL